MSAQTDFERVWKTKFARCLDEVAGETVRRQVLQGSEALSDDSSREEVITWSREAIERLDALVDEEKRREIMAGCACQYPKSALKEIRAAYEATGDTNLAHHMLQEQFEASLRGWLADRPDLVETIIERGWGSAGLKQGNTIVATKIPKRAYLIAYMEETDPQRKRQHYCHCPRIRDILEGSETISPTYCYCGAGFYKGLWEEILQRPVEVGVLESVMQGGLVCKIAIRLQAERGRSSLPTSQ